MSVIFKANAVFCLTSRPRLLLAQGNVTYLLRASRDFPFCAQGAVFRHGSSSVSSKTCSEGARRVQGPRISSLPFTRRRGMTTVLSTYGHNGNKNFEDRDNQPPFIDFRKSDVIFSQKSLSELARSFLVLQFCSFDVFVNNSLKLMNLGMAVLGERFFTAIMRASFYGQFAASPESVRQVAHKFIEASIMPMLATTAEEEVEDCSDQIREDVYDGNVSTMLLCLDMQAEVGISGRPLLSQLKATAYVKASVLAKISEVLRNLDRSFLTDNPVGLANFRSGLDGHLEEIPELTENEMNHLRLALRRFEAILQRAVQKKVRVLVDAEFFCTNEAISLISFALMKKYNASQPTVWNTYQCYLKSAMQNVTAGVAVADAEGFQFGVKVVRGAYMDYERSVAAAQGLTDPVNPTYEATNTMYDHVVAHLMDLVAERGGERVNFIIATHNEDSVQKAVQRMWELGLPAGEGSVVFGQLMGMCDHVSYGLGQSGYLTYKSIPFGPCRDVMANISRRAVENKTVFHRLKQEKHMLRKEIGRRTLSWSQKVTT
ncbi:hydroxyproline dehydrogenase-like [Diadema antillarum]|uniref:hydroxyproline dehydrogenase-like n=1 Tax=Diadema antillarum TaxID=105358 RepID=UPI003A8AFA53